MSYDEALEQILAIVRTEAEARDKCHAQTLLLIEKSEERITRISDIVVNLTRVVEDITKAYTNHIDKIANVRDELANQNSRFIDELHNIRREAVVAGERYNLLLEHYERLAERNAGGNNINVN